MAIGKSLALIAAVAIARSVPAADAAAEVGPQVKPDARYLALLGLMHSSSKSIAKNTSWMAECLENGPYGSNWRTIHEKTTHEDLVAFSKDMAAILSSKTVADAAPAIKGVETMADQLHKDCAYSPDAAKLAMLLAASKAAESPTVASALSKRAAKLRVRALADVAKRKCDFDGKIEQSYALVDACIMGLGLSEVPEDAVYLLADSCSIVEWRDGNVVQVTNQAKEKKCMKLAETGIDVVLAVDGVVSAKESAKAKAAVAVLDKAVKTRIKAVVSPCGASKPSPEESAEMSANCYDAYAMLLEYAKGKSGLPPVTAILDAKSAEVKRMAEKARAKASRQ